MLRVAEAGMYLPLWSTQILDEVAGNLVFLEMATKEQSLRLTRAMTKSFPEAKVEGYQNLIPLLKNQEKDRHVAAAALKGNAVVIVTQNLKDFRNLPAKLAVMTPDNFLCERFQERPKAMTQILIDQAGALKKPKRTVEEVLGALATQVPKFSKLAKKMMEGESRI